MRAMALEKGALREVDCAIRECGAGEVLIRVAYAGINRADLLQKQGRYPLPAGSPCIPGMEISGVVEVCGPDTHGFLPGDRVCALLSEGGYTEKAVAQASLVFKLPDSYPLEQAAALMEAAFTAWISLVWQGRMVAGETFLMHGGASGIGIIALQMARLLGARVFATAGTQQKCELCRALGAEQAIHYHEQDFVAVTKAATGGKGVDIIMDMVGGDYIGRNLEALAVNGRLCIIAFMKGARMQVDLAPLLLKRLSVSGSTLRARPLKEKSQIAEELRKRVWPAIENGAIKPVIDRIFPLADAEKALARMDQGLNCGKILLKCETSPPVLKRKP